MTASNAGDPAMDPGDAGPEATGPDILDPVIVRLAQSGPDRGADRAGSGARIAAVGDRLISPMPADRLWGWVGPLAVIAGSLAGRFMLSPGTVLRIGRLDTIGPANPDRQVVPGQHSPARG